MEALFIILAEGTQLATRTIFELYFFRVMKQFKFQRHRLSGSGSQMNVAKCGVKGKSAWASHRESSAVEAGLVFSRRFAGHAMLSLQRAFLDASGIKAPACRQQRYFINV